MIVCPASYADIAACYNSLELTDRAGCPSDVIAAEFHALCSVPLGNESCSGSLDGKCVTQQREAAPQRAL